MKDGGTNVGCCHGNSGAKMVVMSIATMAISFSSGIREICKVKLMLGKMVIAV